MKRIIRDISKKFAGIPVMIMIILISLNIALLGQNRTKKNGYNTEYTERKGTPLLKITVSDSGKITVTDLSGSIVKNRHLVSNKVDNNERKQRYESILLNGKRDTIRESLIRRNSDESQFSSKEIVSTSRSVEKKKGPFKVSNIKKTTPSSPNSLPDLLIYDGEGAYNWYYYDPNTYTIEMETSVANFGYDYSGDFYLSWYLSDNSTITTYDYLVEYVTIYDLPPDYFDIGYSGIIDLYAMTELPEGTYYLGAYADDLDEVWELDETNNTAYFGEPVYFYPFSADLPDLYVYRGEGSSNYIDYNPETGVLFMENSVANGGGTTAEVFYVSWYLSEDTYIEYYDYLIDYLTMTDLEPGYFDYVNTLEIDLDTMGLADGVYYAGVYIDDEDEVYELDEMNNTAYFEDVVEYIYGGSGLPDLSAYTGEGSSNYFDYDPVNKTLYIESSVGNFGYADAGVFYVSWYLSHNEQISPSDFLFSYADVGGLEAGYFDIFNSGVVDLTSFSELTASTYYVGVYIDDEQEVEESDESNNTLYFSDAIEYTGSPLSTDPEIELPDDNTLMQNYPNPFNPATEISYYLKESSDVSLKVYSTSGELVRELVKGEKSAGYHTVRFDGTGLSSGIYIYVLVSDDYREMKKMVLLK